MQGRNRGPVMPPSSRLLLSAWPSSHGIPSGPCDATKLQAPAVGLAVLTRGPLGSQDHRSAGSRKGKGRVGPARATPRRGLSRSPGPGSSVPSASAECVLATPSGGAGGSRGCPAPQGTGRVLPVRKGRTEWASVGSATELTARPLTLQPGKLRPRDGVGLTGQCGQSGGWSTAQTGGFSGRLGSSGLTEVSLVSGLHCPRQQPVPPAFSRRSLCTHRSGEVGVTFGGHWGETG